MVTVMQIDAKRNHPLHPPAPIVCEGDAGEHARRIAGFLLAENPDAREPARGWGRTSARLWVTTPIFAALALARKPIY